MFSPAPARHQVQSAAEQWIRQSVPISRRKATGELDPKLERRQRLREILEQQRALGLDREAVRPTSPSQALQICMQWCILESRKMQRTVFQGTDEFLLSQLTPWRIWLSWGLPWSASWLRQTPAPQNVARCVPQSITPVTCKNALAYRALPTWPGCLTAAAEAGAAAVDVAAAAPTTSAEVRPPRAQRPLSLRTFWSCAVAMSWPAKLPGRPDSQRISTSADLMCLIVPQPGSAAVDEPRSLRFHGKHHVVTSG